MSENLKVPKQDNKHRAQLVAKGVLGAIPIAGGAVAETFDMIYQSGYEKRLNTWREEVSNRLIKISKSISIEELSQNEEFQSLLTESTIVALKNHQKVKLDAVLNLLINSTESPLEYDFKKLFLNYLDQFTSYHLRTLGVVFENEKLFKTDNYQYAHDLHELIKKEVFHGDEELKGIVLEELEPIKGLIKHEKNRIKDQTTSSLVLTNHGKRFIELVL
ncbi:MAG: hypothetical protein AAGA43_02485 [Bacteroidota bacterium]